MKIKPRVLVAFMIALLIVAVPASAHRRAVVTKPPPPPTAKFTYSPTRITVGVPVTFSYTGSCPAVPCTFTWNDGTTDVFFSHANPFVHIYTKPGSEAVDMFVTDSLGRSRVIEHSFGVFPAKNPPPTTTTVTTPPPTTTTTVTTPPPPPPTTTTTTTTPPPPPGSCAVGTHNVADGPDPFGGCFPGPSNTGVPAGTVLTAYTGPSTISTAGTVIDSKTINGCITVTVPNVTIKNSKITNGCVYSGDGPTEGGFNAPDHILIQDTTVSCGGNGTAFGEANMTILRDNISNCENGGDLNRNFFIQDSYVHDMFNSAESHTDGFQLGGGHFVNGQVVKGGLDITFKHNTIFGVGADGSLGTSAIITNPSGDTNITIDSNLLAGGAFTLYCPRDTAFVNGKVINNVFSRQFSPKVGAFGSSTDCTDENWTNNTLDNGSALGPDDSSAPPPPPPTTTITTPPPPPPPPPAGTCASSIPNTPDGADMFGGCYPGPSNTGVPFGRVLTTYTGPCTITVPNTTIDSKTVNCALTIQAANVTVSNSKVNGNIWLDQDVSGSSGWSMHVTDSEVDSGNQGNFPTICCGMFVVTRVNAHGGLNGGDCEFNDQYCTITDSYYHDPYQPPTTESHLGGFRVGGGTNITLTHNTIWCNPPVNRDGGGCTGDINLLPFAGSTIHGALVYHNLLPAEVGGSFCTYTGTDPGNDHIVYDGNMFQRGTNGKCAVYGPVSSWSAAGTGNIWKPNNLWDDGTLVDPNA